MFLAVWYCGLFGVSLLLCLFMVFGFLDVSVFCDVRGFGLFEVSDCLKCSRFWAIRGFGLLGILGCSVFWDVRGFGLFVFFCAVGFSNMKLKF